MQNSTVLYFYGDFVVVCVIIRRVVLRIGLFILSVFNFYYRRCIFSFMPIILMVCIFLNLCDITQNG